MAATTTVTLRESVRRAARAVAGRTSTREVSTTAHLAAVYPFAVEPGLGIEGVALGTNELSGGGAFFFDLFEVQRQGLIAAPNMLISGAAAHGKSSLAKTYVARSAILPGPYQTPRFTAVIDPKGEWVTLARHLDWAVVSLRPGGDVKVNPLDHGPATGRVGLAGDLRATQTLGVAALLATVLKRGENGLDASEERLLAYLIATLTTARRTTAATLDDLRASLVALDTADAIALECSLEEVRARARPLLDGLALLLDYTLAGMFDRASTIDVDWARSPGLVLDLSPLLNQPLALKLAFVAARGWLQGVMYGIKGRLKLFVIDEAWRALDDVGTVRFFQEAFRMGRQFGAGNILITHALSDLRSQVDDGRAEAKIADGLLATIPCRVYCHQEAEQSAELRTRYGLRTAEVELLPQLAPGQALWKIGAHTAIVQHHVATHEWAWCDTDSAVQGGLMVPRGSAQYA